jgi:hypothetical protein
MYSHQRNQIQHPIQQPTRCLKAMNNAMNWSNPNELVALLSLMQ